MKRSYSALASSLLLAVCGTAGAAPTLQALPPGFYVCDLSYDGTAAAGNIVGDGSYETFFWSAETSVVPLGAASVPAIGAGGGSPDISYDGRHVSASILSSDMHVTLGLWSEETGWLEAFPPVPEFVGVQDQTYGSAWGLSGDGKSVVGYYVSTVNSDVQPCAWSVENGVVDFESPRGRVNAASYDASVVGGWEDSGLGPWFPTVWRDGEKYFLSDALGSTMVNSMNIDGSVVVGHSPDEFGGMQAATIWSWNGEGYDTVFAGYLPETTYGWGSAQFTSVSDDGKIAVGYNRLAFNPNQGGKPIIWTPETGLMNGIDYLTSLGVWIPDDIDLRDFQSISPDGSTIAAAGVNLEYFVYQSIIIRLHAPCAADMNHDWMVEDSDFVVFASSYDVLDCADPAMPLRCPADLNHDGSVDDADFVLFAGAYDALLCE